jgi:prevent-host-death family protein
MKAITSSELARRLSDILNRVRYRGEQFVVQRGGEPVARIEPVGPRVVTVGEFVAFAQTLPRPGKRFADDLEAIQRSQPPALGEFPEWPS